jgi:peptide/nickel transport system permease protein
MTQYIVRRLLINIPVLVGITLIVFALFALIPGDPTAYYINPELGANPAMLARMRAQLGLDDPLPIRYAKWLGQTLTGDFGFRIKNGDPVLQAIWLRLQATFMLAGAALIIGVLVGVSLGVFTALRQYSIWDYSLSGLSFVGVSMPAFITGLFGLYIFSLQIPIFPAGGMQTVGKEPNIGDTLFHLILPAALLSLTYIATFMRQTRFSMLESLHQDFVRTARAKGLRESRVVNVHALRNALLPVVTAIGLNMPSLFVGTVFMETIFSWPGMGTLYLDAVQSRDFPLLMGMNLITAIMVLLINLITDVTYAFIDPRIRFN